MQKKKTQTHTITHTQQEVGVRVNNAGGMMGAHMLSSQDENKVKGTISPRGREKEIKVYSLMLDEQTFFFLFLTVT